MTCDRSVVFSGYSVSSSNKTDCHDVNVIVLKVALTTSKQTNKQTNKLTCNNVITFIFVDTNVRGLSKNGIFVDSYFRGSTAHLYIYIYIYIRLKIKPNSVRIRF